MTSIQKFPKSVIEKLGYYVYLLIDPRTDKVFYVGKGTGNRIFAHVNDALSSPLETDKLDTIRSIHSEGKQVIHKIVRHGLTEHEAFEVEASLIDFINTQELTNIMSGHHSGERGLMNISEIIAQYDAPHIIITEPVILVTVNRLFERNMNEDEIFEITRGDWVVGERRNKAKYVFCVAYSIVRQVYEVQEWSKSKARSPESKTQDRWRFTGVVAKDLQHYVGGCVEKYIGAQNPVRYVNC